MANRGPSAGGTGPAKTTSGGGTPAKAPTQPAPPPAPGRSGPSPTSCKLNSFPGDTPVVLADGSTEQIARLDLGEEVRAVDPATGEVTTAEVSATYVNDDEAFTDLTFTDTSSQETGVAAASAEVRGRVTVHTTSHHRIWDDTAQEFVDAIDLPIGHRARTDDGRTWTLTDTRSWRGAQRMYDITVDDVHTFFIAPRNTHGTHTPILVHNCGDAISNASDAAFRAADNAEQFTVKSIHIEGGRTRKAKFLADVDATSAIAEGLRSPGARFMSNDQLPDTFRVVVNLGRTIGTRGESALRIIVSNDGRVLNAFPVRG